MGEWVETTLDQVVRLKRGFDLPEPERVPGPFPVLGSSGVSGWHNEGPISGPGVTIGRSGASIGVATYWSGTYWPLNTTLFVEDFCGNDPRYIYYLLHNIDFRSYNSGSAQPSLNRNYIANVRVSLPKLGEQQAIAAVLGALDDKIAVNERIAEATRSLGMAQFRAAVDMSSTEHDVASVSAVLVRGVTPRYSDEPDALTVLNQKCIRGGRVSLGPARRTLGGRVPNNKLLQHGDVLVNSTGVGTLGRVARWTGEEKCTVDSHVTIVRFDETKVDLVCAGFAMLAAQAEIERLGEGSTGQTELSRAKLGDFRITLPNSSSCRLLSPKLQALEARGDAALRENQTLAQLRDTLLPKLMSGELRVRDAEKMVEDAT